MRRKYSAASLLGYLSRKYITLSRIGQERIFPSSGNTPCRARGAADDLDMSGAKERKRLAVTQVGDGVERRLGLGRVIHLLSPPSDFFLRFDCIIYYQVLSNQADRPPLENSGNQPLKPLSKTHKTLLFRFLPFSGKNRENSQKRRCGGCASEKQILSDEDDFGIDSARGDAIIALCHLVPRLRPCRHAQARPYIPPRPHRPS